MERSGANSPVAENAERPTRLRKATARQASNAERPTAEILSILHKWGIHTLGQLAALDREALCARLGTEAGRLWERANGTATRLLKFVQPPETFEESFEFEREIETAEPLLFMLRRFLEQLALRLGGIYLVAQQLTLRITFAGSRQDASAARTYERVFKIPQPTNDVDLLFRMLQTHLENFKSKQPIIAVALTAQPVRPVSQQFGLFETALRSPHQLYETLARLTALLGTDRIGTPVMEETHRPDAFRMEPFAWSPRCEPHRHWTGNCAADTAASTQNNLNPDGFPHRLAAASAPLSSSPAGRKIKDEGDGVGLGEGRVRASGLESLRVALRKFRPEKHASVFSSENVPVHLQSDAVLEGARAVDVASGPYLLSGNWWDEKAWARAEWDLQLEEGGVVCAHQGDPPSQNYGVTGGQWAIDGIYD